MVAPGYHVFRAVMETCFCALTVLTSVQLFRDKERFVWAPKMDATHNIFRKAAFLSSFMEIFSNIDYTGVFGIYPPIVRAVYKTASLTILSWGMFTYLYFLAKSCFPFIFRNNLRKNTVRLKVAVVVIWVTANTTDFINQAVSNRIVLLFSYLILTTAFVLVIVVSWGFFLRLRRVLNRMPEQRKKLMVRMKRWRNFTILVTIVIGIVLVEAFESLVLVIQNTGLPLLPLAEKFFANPDVFDDFATGEIFAKTASLLATSLFVYRAWLTEDGIPLRTASSSGSTSGGGGGSMSGSTVVVKRGGGGGDSVNTAQTSTTASYGSRVGSPRKGGFRSRASQHEASGLVGGPNIGGGRTHGALPTRERTAIASVYTMTEPSPDGGSPVAFKTTRTFFPETMTTPRSTSGGSPRSSSIRTTTPPRDGFVGRDGFVVGTLPPTPTVVRSSVTPITVASPYGTSQLYAINPSPEPSQSV